MPKVFDEISNVYVDDSVVVERDMREKINKTLNDAGKNLREENEKLRTEIYCKNKMNFEEIKKNIGFTNKVFLTTETFDDYLEIRRSFKPKHPEIDKLRKRWKKINEEYSYFIFNNILLGVDVECGIFFDLLEYENCNSPISWKFKINIKNVKIDKKAYGNECFFHNLIENFVSKVFKENFSNIKNNEIKKYIKKCEDLWNSICVLSKKYNANLDDVVYPIAQPEDYEEND